MSTLSTFVTFHQSYHSLDNEKKHQTADVERMIDWVCLCGTLAL